MNGIEPVWASEIDKYAIAITSARFPNMLHLGNIENIDGSKIAPTEIITGGSPCQDLSRAGKGEGVVKGNRSSLFFEMIRIIKEMRCETGNQFPRWVVWENVPGAYTSNKGEDFNIVLDEFVKINNHGLSVPRPKGGKWPRAGEIIGDGWSLAWRTLNASGWGVPQRRNRIFLVVDFKGNRSGEILFEREGVQGDSRESSKKRKITPTNNAGGFDGGCGIRIDDGNEVHVFSKRRRAQSTSDYETWEESNVANTVNAFDRGDIRSTEIVITRNLEAYNGGTKYTVRRIMPIESCLLQGFPKHWMDNVPGTDASKYTLWGNGVALPCASFVMSGIVRLASLECVAQKRIII